MTATSFAPIGMHEIKASIKLPENIRSSAVKFSEGEYLHQLVRASGFRKTLETGFGLGVSAASIMSASGGRHVAIDPFQAHYDNCGLKNLETLGLTRNLEFYGDYSHNVLPRLLAQGRTFEFIFIDGDHKFDGQFVDFYYASSLIEQGGFIVLHDTWMRGTSYLTSYVRSNRKDFEPVPQALRNIAVFRKRGADRRGWMHFEGFGGTPRAYLTHKVIQTVHAEEDSLLKRAARRVKDALKLSWSN
jgi:predicted O-methyltransferase YrrM